MAALYLWHHDSYDHPPSRVDIFQHPRNNPELRQMAFISFSPFSMAEYHGSNDLARLFQICCMEIKGVY